MLNSSSLTPQVGPLRQARCTFWQEGCALWHHIGGSETDRFTSASEGLLPSELFVEAFDRNAELIKQLCRLKYQCRDFEKEGELDIVIHRKDIFALST